MSIEEVWGLSWAPGAWADETWGLTEAPVVQPQPASGGGGGSMVVGRRKPASRSGSSGRWVRVDDDDTRREREEREQQRKRAVAEEVQRSLQRLEEIRRAVPSIVEFESAGGVGIGGSDASLNALYILEIGGGGLVEIGSGSVALVHRDPIQTSQHDESARLSAELVAMRKKLQVMERNMQVLEVLLLAA